MADVCRLASGRLRAALLRHLPPDEASDVLQDVLLSVWAARSFDPSRAGAMTWLLAIARHRAFDRLRSDRTVKRWVDPSEGQDAPDPSVSALKALIDDEDRKQLLTALASLPAAQRAAVSAIFLEGLSYPELARRTGQSVSALKGRVRRAVARLRHELGRDPL